MFHYMFISFLPSILSLRALDQYVISDEEIIENLHVSERFKPITSHCRLQLYQSFPKVSGKHEFVWFVLGMKLASFSGFWVGKPTVTRCTSYKVGVIVDMPS